MTTPAKILIVDDEAPARQRLIDVLDDCRESFPLIIADQAFNGLEAIEIMNQGGIDIVLTDIRMPMMDGLEVARHLSRLEKPPKLIFTTAYDDYAIQAFELNAVDYLLKPIRQERLLAALLKASPIKSAQVEAIASATQSRRRHLAIHERGKIILVPLDGIIYFKSELKYVTVKTSAHEYILEESLTHLETEFSDLFVRIHRSVLVARKSVLGFEKVADDPSGSHWVAVLQGLDEKLPVSRRQHHVMREF